MNSRLSLAVAALVFSGLTVVTGALPASPASAAPGGADLRVDADRDGAVDLGPGGADEAGEGGADVRAGALFLANIDDDASRCPTTRHGKRLHYGRLSRCNDAADEVVDGAADVLDLARIQSVPLVGLSAGATGTIALDAASQQRAHLFLLDQGSWRYVDGSLAVTAAQLAQGLTLGLEGRDVVRTTAWNGDVSVILTVSDQGATTSDAVTLHEAPVLTTNHTQPAEQLMTTVFTRAEARAAQMPRHMTALSRHFATRLDRALAATGHQPLLRLHGGDMFPQDIFEQLYTSVPGPGGLPHTMRVVMLSPQPWREAQFELYQRFRGPDSAVLRLPEDPKGHDGIGQTYSSTGDVETIPPYSFNGHDYPDGRVLVGGDPGGREAAAPSITDLFTAQGLQTPLQVDTAWTFVGHVDESIQFVPAQTPRGWKVVIADPRAGLRLLRTTVAEGHGDAALFDWGRRGYARLTTIEEYLHDPDHVLVQENRVASRHAEANLRLLEQETGLTEADVVRVPALFGSINLDWGHTVPTPPMTPLLDAVNGIVLDAHHALVPHLSGPRIHGRELFDDAVAAAYAAAGISVTAIPDQIYSINGGEIHCATNVFRAVVGAWWRSPA